MTAAVNDQDRARRGLTHLVRLVLLLIAFCLVLAVMGCTTPPLATVKVPVPVECNEKIPERPAMPSEALVSAVPIDGFVAALLADIGIREGYEVRLLTALLGCTKPIAGPPSPTPVVKPP